MDAKPDILALLADISEAQAALFLDAPPDVLGDADRVQSHRPFAIEARIWTESNGDRDPAGWLSRAVFHYLAEASHQLAAVAVLIRNRAVHATLDPLIRAILERCGRTCWLLDPEATASQRAARAQFEVGVCALHYAEALEQLKADDQTRSDLRTFRSAQRARVHDRHEVVTNGEKKVMSVWSIDGETYPAYTETVSYALDRHPQSAAVYASLSGFAHPNVFFAAERVDRTVSTTNVMIVHMDELERDLRIALTAHLAAVKRWATYYLDPEVADAIVAAGDQLADDLDEASVISDEDPR